MPGPRTAWPAGTGPARNLVFDGYFDVQAQQWETAWRWGGALPGISGTVRPEDVWGGTTW
ncbi:hypothetical protein Shyd_69030 [Streptomyces hydrogenans]|uniref:Uncharacterized protein n=1 Tax=Streptomyces hydrogenans TaxID=1873719 RepID=A0ABQ3PKJ1_9ACTN|nr:hypothetical protein Shyd_69030 [Streptomyces hydrogenans]